MAAMAVKDDRRVDVTVRLNHSAPQRLNSQVPTAIANLSGRPLEPNRGVPLNRDWLEEVRVNTSAVERRTQTLVTRRTVKK